MVSVFVSRILIVSVIVFGLVFGGNSVSNGLTDQFLLIYTVVVSGIIIAATPGPSKVEMAPLVLAVVGLVLVAVQLIPLPFFGVLDSQDAVPPELVQEVQLLRDWLAISLDVARTTTSLAWLATLVMFLFALAKQSLESLLSVVPVLLGAVVVNMVLALFQFTLLGQEISAQWIGGSLQAGFFANPNHLGTLIFISVPPGYLLLRS